MRLSGSTLRRGIRAQGSVALFVAASFFSRDVFAGMPALTLMTVCSRIRSGSPSESAESVLARLFQPTITDRWDVELLRRADGTLVDVMVRLRAPRHPLADRVFSCAGELDSGAAAARASAYATQPPAPAAGGQ